MNSSKACELIKVLTELYPFGNEENPSIKKMLENFSFKQCVAWLILKGTNDFILTEEDKELLRNEFLRK